MSAHVTPDGERVLPRTWCGWWHSWPKWLRIGARACLGVVIVQVLILTYLCIGQIEAPEIRALRQRHARIHYWWESDAERFPLDHWVQAGWHGKSCRNVLWLAINRDGTDRDLAVIGTRFQQLRWLEMDGCTFSEQGLQAISHLQHITLLSLAHSTVTSEGLKSIQSFQQLETLDLSNTEVDDEGVRSLSDFANLRSLNLAGTLISQSSIALLQRMRKLRLVTIRHTGVVPPANPAKTESGTIWNHTYSWNSVQGVVRWSDGMQSATYRGHYEIIITRPGDNGHPSHHVEGVYLTRDNLRWSGANLNMEGSVYFMLILGSYRSEPVVVHFKNEVPSIPVIEFKMPVPRLKAYSHSSDESVNASSNH